MRIKEVIKEKGYTQKEFAEKLGITSTQSCGSSRKRRSRSPFPTAWWRTPRRRKRTEPVSYTHLPTVLPVSSRLSTVNLVRDGVTVPSSTQGKAKITRQAASAAQTRKFFVTNVALSYPGEYDGGCRAAVCVRAGVLWL